jgi:hypothetical protein
MVVVEEDVRRRRDQQFLGLKGHLTASTSVWVKVRLILEPTEMVQSAIGKRVTVLDFPDGRLVICHEGVDPPYRTFDKVRQVKQTSS